MRLTLNHTLWVILLLISLNIGLPLSLPASVKAALTPSLPLKVFYRASWRMVPWDESKHEVKNNDELFTLLDTTLRRHLGLYHRKVHISVAQCNATSSSESKDVCFTNTIRVDDEESNGQVDPQHCVQYPTLAVGDRFLRLPPKTTSLLVQVCEDVAAFTICQTREGVFAAHNCIDVVNRTDLFIDLYPGWNNISVLVHDSNSNQTSSSRSVYVEPQLVGTSRPKPLAASKEQVGLFEEIQVISLRSNLHKGYQRVLNEEVSTSKLLRSVSSHLFEAVVVEPGILPLQTLVEEHVISGVVRDRIMEQEERNSRVVAINLTRGAIGCALSHIAIWRRAVSTNRTILILEDDIMVAPDIDSRLQLPGLQDALHRQQASLVYLGVPPFLQGSSKRSKPVEGMPTLRILYGENYGTYAYIITPRGALRLLDGVFPLKQQVDSWISTLIVSGDIHAVAVDPSWIIEVKSLRESSVQTGYNET